MDPLTNPAMAPAGPVAVASDNSIHKRKRSPSASPAVLLVAPPAKINKTSSHNQLSINYLVRQSAEDLPLLHKDDALPNILALLSQYSAVLDRHESLASNLGARPLGPILIKRFERCFDAPPRIVATHLKGPVNGTTDDDSHLITWLEVIEFARSHPSQFTLSAFSEGRRVCQFYYPQKQLRVQISEEDFLFINSGRCQELIPPLPIWEDEEKEVGACDVLDAKLKEVTNVADMVAARTRQLSHRLKGRRAAILERRAEGGSGTPAKAIAQQTTTAPPSSTDASYAQASLTEHGHRPNEDGHRNGRIPPPPPSSGDVYSTLLRHFESLPHNQNQPPARFRHPSMGGYPDTSDSARLDGSVSLGGVAAHDRVSSSYPSMSPDPPYSSNVEMSRAYPTEGGSLHRSSVAPAHDQSGHRPSSSAGGPNSYSAHGNHIKHNFSRPLAPALESSQPFRPVCQAHMDGLPRGHRVLPPCDRCRRLRMDCVKNLTSCAGCTKKHARCHWRDVSQDELGMIDHIIDESFSESTGPGPHGYTNGHHRQEESDDDDSNPLEDLEALVEKEERENAASTQQSSPKTQPTLPMPMPVPSPGPEVSSKEANAVVTKDEAPAIATAPAAIESNEPIDDSTIQVVPRKSKGDDVTNESGSDIPDVLAQTAPDMKTISTAADGPPQDTTPSVPVEPVKATNDHATFRAVNEVRPA